MPGVSTQIIIANVKRANVCQTLPWAKGQVEELSCAVVHDSRKFSLAYVPSK